MAEHHKHIPHDTALEESYGSPIPQPKPVKGEQVAFGELAGSTSTAKSLEPKRNIHFNDSIDDNRHNQPKSL